MIFKRKQLLLQLKHTVPCELLIQDIILLELNSLWWDEETNCIHEIIVQEIEVIVSYLQSDSYHPVVQNK